MTMDTAGKAVLFSGVTVLISLSAVMLVPEPGVPLDGLGIMLSVVFVLLATLTLLPAVLARLGDRVDRLALHGCTRASTARRASPRWGELLWRRPAPIGLPAPAMLVAARAPGARLDTGMPSIKVVPEDDGSRVGYDQVQEAFGPGAPGRCRSSRPAAQGGAGDGVAGGRPGDRRRSPPPQRSGGRPRSSWRYPRADPSDPAVGATIERLRDALPAGALVGGAAAENHDLEEALARKTLLVFGVVLALGFLLLLVALQAPLIALVGVLTNLLATAAAFGVARADLPGREPRRAPRLRVAGLPQRLGARLLLRDDLRHLDGLHRVPALLGEGALGPHRATRRRRWSADSPTPAATIFAAGAVMVAVFFTFALSGPIPPKEMGVILGVAVLLDAMLIRLVLMPVLLRADGPKSLGAPRLARSGTARRHLRTRRTQRALPQCSLSNPDKDAVFSELSPSAAPGERLQIADAGGDSRSRSGAAAPTCPAGLPTSKGLSSASRH